MDQKLLPAPTNPFPLGANSRPCSLFTGPISEVLWHLGNDKLTHYGLYYRIF